MRKRLGIIRHGYARPLVSGLGRLSPDSPVHFELIQDAASKLVLKLLQDELEGAFLSPIEYAKHYSRLRIIDGVCVSSEGMSGTIEVHFRDDLKNITTLAINPESTSETLLAKMILSEKFNATPRLIAVQNTSPEVLKKADSVLVVGDDCSLWQDHANKLDLVDEWFDTNELPFVHGFWVTRNGMLSSEDIELLQHAAPAETVADGISPDDDALLERFEFSFQIDERAIAGLNEFYKSAYYYGVLPDIPDLNFLSSENEGYL